MSAVEGFVVDNVVRQHTRFVLWVVMEHTIFLSFCYIKYCSLYCDDGADMLSKL